MLGTYVRMYCMYIQMIFLQNLITINDNIYSPQNEVAYNILDAKQEVST